VCGLLGLLGLIKAGRDLIGRICCCQGVQIWSKAFSIILTISSFQYFLSFSQIFQLFQLSQLSQLSPNLFKGKLKNTSSSGH
jgi:hypothetical protein